MLKNETILIFLGGKLRSHCLYNSKALKSEFDLTAINLITSTGTVRFYSRCLSRSHHMWGDGGGGSAPAQVCGWAAGPRACWEDTSGETVQSQLAQQYSLSVKIWGVDTGVGSPPQLLRCSGVKAHDHSAALLDCNRSKNRSGAVMPGEPNSMLALLSSMLLLA